MEINQKRKSSPIPVRFAPKEEGYISEVQKLLSLSKSEIIRRCVEHFLPRVISGEVNLLTLAKREDKTHE